MEFKVIVLRGDREVGSVTVSVGGSAAEREEQILEAGRRVERVMLEPTLEEVADQSRVLSCCGRAMKNCGHQTVTIKTVAGEVPLTRRRYRCEQCGHTVYQGDAAILCGAHRITRPLAQRICQLVESEHYPHLPQVLSDQHGVHVTHQEINELVQAVGGQADEQRRAEAAAWKQTPAEQRAWPVPEVTPERIYVSCDGVMYCTNETEPDPHHPGQQRLIWQQMRVGCVYWQDASGRWSKRVLWGREAAEDFGASLFRLACQCGWRGAREKLFGADGGDWCWTIHQRYFSEAVGILDWYHASEHVWQAAHLLRDDAAAAQEWATQALDQLRAGGGSALEQWLQPQRPALRKARRRALNDLLNYVRPRTHLMDYPTYRAHHWQVGTGMIESTGKQLVGQRLKGPGMHWTERGALAVAALRATDLNGQWKSFWKNLVLST